jgi:glycosyltransferase involved in cell wall biosynthesis
VYKRQVKNRLLFYRKIIFYKLFCNTVVCPSGLAKKDLEKFYHSKKGFVILNPMQDRFLAKNNLEANRIIISYLGRLDPSKGVLELIRAFKIYSEENKSSNIILNIAGTGSQVDEIKKMINDQDNILYFGGLPYDKVDAYLSQSHFVIIPSKIDNLPTVGLEAMMNGTPLLISKNVGLSDYLEDERACFKFEPHQESMVLLFKKVETNFFQQVQMGKEARNTFLNKFSIRNYCHCFSEIIVKKWNSQL